MSKRLTTLKTILWAFTGALMALSVVRFWRGLGATTNLSDATPWGLWIALDVMAGVALAAGGFVLAGTVYIFGLEKYRPLVRPAILTAFLGYIAVAVGLFYDLGLPWHIWHPMVYWQHHSVLFEVAMCVMTYLAVLAMEFSPVVLEHPSFGHPVFRGILKFLKTFTIPLVIAGIVLSTLHQSSLGSLFLIMPHRLHALWYSPIIYVQFFVSAVALGMMMVTMESLLSGYFFAHKVRRDLLSGLGKAAAVVLWFYTALRLGDLAVRGVIPAYLDGSWQSVLFVAELLTCAVIPAVLLSISKVRNKTAGMAAASVMVVAGMVWNRLDVAIVAVDRPDGMGYFPSWMEFVVSIGVMSVAMLAFVYLVERLRVYEDRVKTDPPKRSYDPATLHSLTPYILSAPRAYSMAFVLAASVCVMLLPRDAIFGVQPVTTPVLGVRTVEGVVYENGDGLALRLELVGAPTAQASSNGLPTRYSSLMLVNGNRDDTMVLFDHDGHAARIARITAGDSCAACHHLNMPYDRNSSCSECHSDMYEPTNVFDHASHVRKLKGNDGCVKCHDDGTEVKTRETATPCGDCHKNQVAVGSMVDPPEPSWRNAAGYMTAMHKLCITCHRNNMKSQPDRFATNLDRCDACHDAGHIEKLKELIPTADNEPEISQMVSGAVK